MQTIARRQFLQFLGTGAAMSVGALEAACTHLQPVDSGNPLSRAVSRDWEKIYHDQYHYDSSFDWVCSPNDTVLMLSMMSGTGAPAPADAAAYSTARAPPRE